MAAVDRLTRARGVVHALAVEWDDTKPPRPTVRTELLEIPNEVPEDSHPKAVREVSATATAVALHDTPLCSILPGSVIMLMCLNAIVQQESTVHDPSPASARNPYIP